MEGECEGAVTSGEGVTEIAGGVVRQWMNRLTTEGGGVHLGFEFWCMVP